MEMAIVEKALSSSRLDSQFFNILESPAVLPCYFPTLLIQQNIIFPGEAGGERERVSLEKCYTGEEF
jgi:hypothetical protein